MKIAIIAPSPVPFTVGGAEQLFWGIQDAIHEYTSHQCELVKIPTREDNFWDLIASYDSFYTLDLSHFDMVISTKYPSWMVQHGNHIVYMVHPLRGLYDTYHFCNLPTEIPAHLCTGLVEDILDIIHEKRFSKDAVNAVFENLRLLKEEEARYHPETFQFPGPFIRDIIHFFDGFALSPERIQRYCTMSETVRRRHDYFPIGINVDVIHPPSKLDNFTNIGYDYLFTASRLDGPKRIDLIINAMKYVPHDIKLKIAGTGPEEQKLRKIAEDDKRVEFVGFVHENELIDLYGQAQAVLFTPYDEDYGLITLEAMLSNKPVITTTDSGGPLELVRNGQSGFVVDPDPQKIAEKINYCIEHPEEARKMGRNGYLAAQDITWEMFARRLLGDADSVRPQKKRKVLVLATYSCYPPRGGGQHRLYNLYSRLAKHYDVTICSIIESNKPYQNLTLENGLRQICIPQSREHAEAQWKAEKKVGVNLYDVAMIDHVELSRNYVDTVKGLMEQSDTVIFAHPYLFPLYKSLGQGKRVIYDAVDVEYQQKRDYIKNADYLEEIFKIEKLACMKSDAIFAISSENRELLVNFYGIDPDKISIVPNGVDSSLIQANDEERERLKERVGLSGIPTILFVGSWHPPNLKALRFIVKDLQKRCKNCLFLIVGSVKDYYTQEYGKLPKNVLAFGTVDEDEKRELYKLADIAINPMFGGSGTNLKMLDYMSAGIPVVTTPIGARGIPITNYEHAIVCPPEQMAGKIQELISDSWLREHLRNNARSLVEDGFSWDSIARRLEERLQKLLDREY